MSNYKKDDIFNRELGAWERSTAARNIRNIMKDVERNSRNSYTEFNGDMNEVIGKLLSGLLIIAAIALFHFLF